MSYRFIFKHLNSSFNGCLYSKFVHRSLSGSANREVLKGALNNLSHKNVIENAVTNDLFSMKVSEDGAFNELQGVEVSEKRTKNVNENVATNDLFSVKASEKGTFNEFQSVEVSVRRTIFGLLIKKVNKLFAWYGQLTGMDEVRMTQNSVIAAQNRLESAQKNGRKFQLNSSVCTKCGMNSTHS
uniref:Uncharacterized protein n=1 Tax=Lygus hesperus TaxID=30085 RepID=A0A0K8SML6_LYGHE